ncbi:MAG: hypothetical protein GY862_00655, partial [Gammaproteobacteria bacterium]|nr:hypothetical protein [Gammaproteobacteria bacterium]
MDLEYLTESTCLLYAELLQQCCRAAPSGQGISFVRKKRRDKTYWYIQCSIGNKKSQYYLGPDSPELRDKIAAEKQLWKTVLPELKKRQKLVAMLNAGGVYTVTANEARVLLLMERIGVFLAGGVLVGSHAFKLYENMLGVRWEAQAVKTFDIDVADDNRRLAIGMTNKPVNLGEALLQSNMGFFEVPALDRKHPSSSFFVRGQQLQVDVLTPMPKNKPPSSKPIYLNSLNTPATPLIFLDFVLEDVQPAV